MVPGWAHRYESGVGDIVDEGIDSRRPGSRCMEGCVPGGRNRVGIRIDSAAAVEAE